MAKKYKKHLPGKKFKIDEKELIYLCTINCTLEEIANFFNVSPEVLENYVIQKYNMSFAQFYQMHATKGKVSIRREQFRQALAGNTQMLMYLGKVLLGQREGLMDVKVVFEFVDNNNLQKDENNQSESDKNL